MLRVAHSNPNILIADAVARLFDELSAQQLDSWIKPLQSALDHLANESPHGRLPAWRAAVNSLPALDVDAVKIADVIEIAGHCDDVERQTLRTALQALKPWRKGPFHAFGIKIDSEWRSDLKWQRIYRGLAPLAGRRVLDVGGGHGYYAFRAWGAGAALVVNLDPSILFNLQFQAISRYVANPPVHTLPLGDGAIPPGMTNRFDTVMSMGVLYHRRNPIEHLQQLRAATREGGQVVVETLVIEGAADEMLQPESRYAQMRNVWCIPSIELLESWVRAAGYRDVQLIDVTPTTAAEQRRTDWIDGHSLADFLSPEDPGRTIEGYPAPVRACVTGIASRDASG